MQCFKLCPCRRRSRHRRCRHDHGCCCRHGPHRQLDRRQAPQRPVTTATMVAVVAVHAAIAIKVIATVVIAVTIAMVTGRRRA